MAETTSKMGLAAWDGLLDPYNYQQLANNWNILDFHDHTPGRGVPIPIGGLAPGAVGPGNLAPGAISASALSLGLAQSAGINETGQTTKGAVSIAGAQNVGSTSYTLLTTPDQVTNIVLPTNGLLAIWYQAQWQESVLGAARAAIFINSNQLTIQAARNPATSVFVNGPVTQAAATSNSAGSTGIYLPLSSSAYGLVSASSSTNLLSGSADVTTGQIVGAFGGYTSLAYELNGGGATPWTVATAAAAAGGPCWVFAAAGTYTVSVEFKATSGTVTVNNRKLWVQAFSYA